MEPADYLQIIRRRWLAIVVLVLIGLAVAYVTAPPSSAAPPRPEAPSTSFLATTILELPSTTADPSGFNLDSMAFIARSGPVPSMTARALHDRGGRADVESRVNVSARDTVNALEVSASGKTAAGAARLANGFSRQLIRYINDEMLSTYRAELAGEQARLKTLSAVVAHIAAQPSSSLQQGALTAARNEYAQEYLAYEQEIVTGPGQTGLHVLVPASRGQAVLVGGGGGSDVAPVHHSDKKRLAFGGGAGLVAGLGLAFVWERLDTRIRSREQAERAFGLPILGEVPITARHAGRQPVVVVKHPVSSSAEAYRMLQTGLSSLAGSDATGRSSAILLASPCPLEGKETVLANLAATFSEAGSSVVLVAGDAFDLALPTLIGTRRPRGRSRRSSLALTTATTQGPEEQSRAVPTAIEGVSLLMNGQRPEIGNGHAHRHLDPVAIARTAAEVVLVDSPPVLVTHDAGRLSSSVDSVVLMCEVGRLSARDASLAAEVLRRVGAPLQGVVLVVRPSSFARMKGGGGDGSRWVDARKRLAPSEVPPAPEKTGS